MDVITNALEWLKANLPEPDRYGLWAALLAIAFAVAIQLGKRSQVALSGLLLVGCAAAFGYVANTAVGQWIGTNEPGLSTPGVGNSEGTDFNVERDRTTIYPTPQRTTAGLPATNRPTISIPRTSIPRTSIPRTSIPRTPTPRPPQNTLVPTRPTLPPATNPTVTTSSPTQWVTCPNGMIYELSGPWTPAEIDAVCDEQTSSTGSTGSTNSYYQEQLREIERQYAACKADAMQAAGASGLGNPEIYYAHCDSTRRTALNTLQNLFG